MHTVRIGSAKVSPPRADRTVGDRGPHRAALDALLDGGLRAALVVAPRGYGKTTLTASWAEQVSATGRARVAWVSLAEGDDTPGRLWSLLVAALGRALPGVGELTLEHPALPRSPGDHAFIEDVLCGLEASGERIVLVLDAVQHLAGSEVLGDLDYVLRWSPGNLRTVLLSRAAPDLPTIGELDMAGRLAVVTQGDLTLGRGEVTALLGPGAGALADEVLRMTEGWPLAVSAVRGDQADRAGRPIGFGRRVGLLRQTLLGRSPHATLKVLHALDTAGPCTEECVQDVAACPEARTELVRLTTEEGTVVRETDSAGRSVYRLHRLIRGRLRGPDGPGLPASARSAIEARAARWSAARGTPVEAMRHALATGDGGLVDAMARGAGVTALVRGDLDLLGPALSDGPATSWTGLLRAGRALDEGRLEAAGAALAGLGTVRSGPTVRDGREALRRVLDAGLEAARGRPGADPGPGPGPVPSGLRPALEFLRGRLLLAAGHRSAAREALERAADAARGRADPGLLCQCLTGLAALELWGGRPGAAAAFGARALGAATSEAGGATGETSLAAAHLVTGVSALHRADIPVALAHCESATRSARWHHLPVPFRYLCKYALAVRFADGGARTRLADEFLESWEADADGGAPRADVALGGLTAAWMALRARPAAGVGRIRRVLRRRLGMGAELAVVTAWSALVLGDLDSAHRNLRSVTAGYLLAESAVTEQVAWLLMAQLHHRTKAPDPALECLQRAVAIGLPRASLLPFAQMPWGVKDLVLSARSRLVRTPEGAELADLVRRMTGDSDVALVRRLTAREREILRELPHRGTVSELGRALFISGNTVKTHLRGVYRKLGVSSRQDAVAEARRLGLL